MPPHCDSMDGPVVAAARRALETESVDLVLPYVHAPAEAEVRATFDLAVEARQSGPAARRVADLYFFETVVRVHRAGEGAPYTGLKPAGLGEGPVIPLAEKAIDTGSIEELLAFLGHELEEQLQSRLDAARSLAPDDGASVAEVRSYVEAVLGFQVYSHHLYLAMRGPSHGA